MCVTTWGESIYYIGLALWCAITYPPSLPLPLFLRLLVSHRVLLILFLVKLLNQPAHVHTHNIIYEIYRGTTCTCSFKRQLSIHSPSLLRHLRLATSQTFPYVIHDATLLSPILLNFPLWHSSRSFTCSSNLYGLFLFIPVLLNFHSFHVVASLILLQD